MAALSSLSFNSSIVRLVPLSFEMSSTAKRRFNSSIVRLVHLELGILNRQLSGFNSSIVRLVPLLKMRPPYDFSVSILV